MSKTVVFNKEEKGIHDAPDRFVSRCYRVIGKIMELGRQKARELAPESMGRLKGTIGGYGGITYRVFIKGKFVIGILSASAKDPLTGVDYVIFVHEGTGLFGPKKSVIRPKKAKALAFMISPNLPRPTTPHGWKMARIRGLAVIIKYSKGQEPQPFLRQGLEEASKMAKIFMDEEIEAMNREVSL
jgi:hypothetical protein